MTKIDKLISSGKAHTKVNRDPKAQRGEHGVLDIKLSAPGGDSLDFIATELHPIAEQWFSGAWSGCYITLFGVAARQKKVTLPPDHSVDIQVEMVQIGAALSLRAEFTIRVPGLEKEVVEAIAHSAHQLCPYSKSVHGNIEISTNIVTEDQPRHAPLAEARASH
jgi:Ohr subfamily peroxiredoxin